MIDVLAAIHNVDVFKDTTVYSWNIYSFLNLKGMFTYFAFEIVFLESYISKQIFSIDILLINKAVLSFEIFVLSA